jgi:PKD repeat protein
VVAWGWNGNGQTSVPAGLTDVVAISGGRYHSLALVAPNEPPVSDPNGPYLGAVDAAISFNGEASSDPDEDALRFDWNWGDGTSSGDTGATPTHSYEAAGIYDVCLTTTDPYGESDTVCTYVVVYDPAGGFVTGGGWLDSPEGAYASDPSLTGRAGFGFVSTYKKGAGVPTGNTEFQFQAADLTFHSSSYEWLVVTGDDYAKFKGVGTVNGMGEYKFQLWAGDREADTFRIKIWTENELGVETVVYDNGMDQAIGGGSIVVHTKK